MPLFRLRPICLTFKHRPIHVVSQITNTEYFAPLLTVNQHASHTVLEEIPSVDTFASLSNWLMRPVPTVTTAVRRFRERYFEDNYVIGEYMSECRDSFIWTQTGILNESNFVMYGTK